MDRGNILSGFAFKSALLAAGIFLLVLITTGVGAFFHIERAMTDELEAQITEEIIFFRAIYEDGGASGLIETIKSLDLPVSSARPVIGIFGKDGAKLAGHIDRAPDFVGWGLSDYSKISGRSPPDVTAMTSFYVNSTPLGDVTLVVGRNLDLLRKAEITLIRTLALSGFVVVLAILMTGYILSWQSLSKLQLMESTLNRVSQGDTSARLVISSHNDQIDRIARQMNIHLDRLSDLMTHTRSTAAAIAHDLRTPLSRAFLGLETAMGRIEKGQDPRDAIERSQSELTRLGGIVDTILRIARIEAQTAENGFKRFDLAPIIDDLSETFAAVAEEKGQCLSLEKEPGAALDVDGDASMLQQMIANLIQNAIAHCPAGSRLTVAAGTEGGRVRLSVSDTGPGIPESERIRVFDPFFRIDRNRSTEGTGLGLSLVKAIAERHGATITLSDNMPGLRVTVVFPAPHRH